MNSVLHRSFCSIGISILYINYLCVAISMYVYTVPKATEADL